MDFTPLTFDPNEMMKNLRLLDSLGVTLFFSAETSQDASVP